MKHHLAGKGGMRRPEGPMSKPLESIVALSPVRDADRRGDAVERIAELHRQVRAGVYDNMATIDAVARRILQSGDL
jgi:hypothetical protein